MPSRGYRKGVSDDKCPRPHVVKSRLTADAYQVLVAEADDRAMTFSSLIAHIVAAHVTGQRNDLPHRRGVDSAALRELCRIGNNLNQIAHQANLMNLPLIEEKAIATLTAVHEAARRLMP